MQEKILSLLQLLTPYDTNHKLIRVGREGDGGYVLPECVSDISSVVSLGISDEVSFDLYFAERGIDVFQFDPTVDGPPFHNSKFHFTKEGFGTYDGVMHNTLDDILDKCKIRGTGNKLLKFDVEGSEYVGIFNSSDQALQEFSVLTGEFHSLDWMQKPDYYNTFYYTFKKIVSLFAPVHVHANNGGLLTVIDNISIPSLLEITFLRRDLISSMTINQRSRSELDFKNVPENSSIFWNPTHYLI